MYKTREIYSLGVQTSKGWTSISYQNYLICDINVHAFGVSEQSMKYSKPWIHVCYMVFQYSFFYPFDVWFMSGHAYLFYPLPKVHNDWGRWDESFLGAKASKALLWQAVQRVSFSMWYFPDFLIYEAWCYESSNGLVGTEKQFYLFNLDLRSIICQCFFGCYIFS